MCRLQDYKPTPSRLTQATICVSLQICQEFGKKQSFAHVHTQPHEHAELAVFFRKASELQNHKPSATQGQTNLSTDHNIVCLHRTVSKVHRFSHANIKAVLKDDCWKLKLPKHDKYENDGSPQSPDYNTMWYMFVFDEWTNLKTIVNHWFHTHGHTIKLRRNLVLIVTITMSCAKRHAMLLSGSNITKVPTSNYNIKSYVPISDFWH